MKKIVSIKEIIKPESINDTKIQAVMAKLKEIEDENKDIKGRFIAKAKPEMAKSVCKIFELKNIWDSPHCLSFVCHLLSDPGYSVIYGPFIEGIIKQIDVDKYKMDEIEDIKSKLKGSWDSLNQKRENWDKNMPVDLMKKETCAPIFERLSEIINDKLNKLEAKVKGLEEECKEKIKEQLQNPEIFTKDYITDTPYVLAVLIENYPVSKETVLGMTTAKNILDNYIEQLNCLQVKDQKAAEAILSAVNKDGEFEIVKDVKDIIKQKIRAKEGMKPIQEQLKENQDTVRILTGIAGHIADAKKGIEQLRNPIITKDELDKVQDYLKKALARLTMGKVRVDNDTVNKIIKNLDSQVDQGISSGLERELEIFQQLSAIKDNQECLEGKFNLCKKLFEKVTKDKGFWSKPVSMDIIRCVLNDNIMPLILSDNLKEVVQTLGEVEDDQKILKLIKDMKAIIDNAKSNLTKEPDDTNKDSLAQALDNILGEVKTIEGSVKQKLKEKEELTEIEKMHKEVQEILEYCQEILESWQIDKLQILLFKMAQIHSEDLKLEGDSRKRLELMKKLVDKAGIDSNADCIRSYAMSIFIQVFDKCSQDIQEEYRTHIPNLLESAIQNRDELTFDFVCFDSAKKLIEMLNERCHHKDRKTPEEINSLFKKETISPAVVEQAAKPVAKPVAKPAAKPVAEPPAEPPAKPPAESKLKASAPAWVRAVGGAGNNSSGAHNSEGLDTSAGLRADNMEKTINYIKGFNGTNPEDYIKLLNDLRDIFYATANRSIMHGEIHARKLELRKEFIGHLCKYIPGATDIKVKALIGALRKEKNFNVFFKYTEDRDQLKAALDVKKNSRVYELTLGDDINTTLAKIVYSILKEWKG